MPETFELAQAGEAVWLDDGMIGAVILENRVQELELELELKTTHVPPREARLRAEKSINFPDLNLVSQALTSKDKEDLAALFNHVDRVARSFVHSPEYIRALGKTRLQLKAEQTGMVLRSENAGCV